MVLRNERSLLVAPNWMPDDTEESVVGTEWHQEAIGALAMMLRDVADQYVASWGVCEQIELGGLQRANRTSYSPRPDVMVLAHPLDGRRAGIPLAEAGPPLFIAEVASTTTVRNDLEGKREVYAAIGIREYVIFDPMEAVLGVALQAWRLTSDDAAVYDPWEPEADGWWRSRALGLSLRPDGAFLALRHRDGALIEHPRTTARLLHSTRQRLREEQLARQTLEADLEQLRAQLDQRDDQDSPIS